MYESKNNAAISSFSTKLLSINRMGQYLTVK